MKRIVVYGTSGVGKSSFAEGVERRAKAEGLTCSVNDHWLYTNNRGFAKELEKVWDRLKDESPDIAVVVINDGGKLRIEFEDWFSHSLHSVIFPGCEKVSA